MYVTLEPCCHYGKTGPCTQTIIDAGLTRVVIAVRDPSGHAHGQGIEELQRAGIDVEVGVCEEEARRLNAPFFKSVETGRPWVIAKWAQSIDGKLAYTETSSERRWISNEASRSDVHRLRRRTGAIVVGINTILTDNPLLTPRPSKGKKPIRVVLDSKLRIPLGSRVLRTTKTCPTLVFTHRAAVDANPRHAERIAKKGAEVLVYEGEGGSDLQFLLAELGKRGVQQVLVEGGPRVLTSFLREKLADEVCVYIAPKVLGGGGAAYIGEPMAESVQAMGLDHVEVKAFGEDVRIRGLVPVVEEAAQEPVLEYSINVEL